MKNTYIIPGEPRTKKNSMVIAKGAKERYFLLPSKPYREYEKTALPILISEEDPINTPVNITCLYFMKTRRKVDLTNLLEATDDILVKAGILEDDNCRIVVGHDGSRVFYDKSNPRVEITIEEIESS